MSRQEEVYQANLIRRLEHMFPGCVVVRLDPRFVDFYVEGKRYSQGVADILILFGSRWAMLEVKAAIDAPVQPNQPYFINMFDALSYAAFISPENEEEILYDLQHALRPQRIARLSRR